MSLEQIAGILVHARPDLTPEVAMRLGRLPGVSVQEDLGGGRLIVVAESAGERQMVEAFTAIRDIDGVLSASLTYHYTDHSGSLEEEIPA